MKSAAQIRAQVEASLEAKVSSPFNLRESSAPEMVPIGGVAGNALPGGLPRSSLTEISGPPSSGRTTVELALLASLTAKGEACALVDAEDALDPVSAEAAGVRLDHLLWVRCGGLAQALRATDLLLGAGGFGAVILDLAGIPARWTRRVPLSYWFRFRRAVENTPTVLMLVDEEPCAGSSASLVLRLEAEGAIWSESTKWKGETQNSKSEIRKAKFENRDSEVADEDLKFQIPDEPESAASTESLRANIMSLHPAESSLRPPGKPPYHANLLPHARLLRGIRWRAEVVRNRYSEIRKSIFENRGCA